jgi:hypothetical protein
MSSPNLKQRGSRLKPLPNNKGRTGALVTAHVTLERGMVSPDAAVLKSGVSTFLGEDAEQLARSREFLRDDSFKQSAGAPRTSQRYTLFEQGESGDRHLLASPTREQKQVSEHEGALGAPLGAPSATNVDNVPMLPSCKDNDELGQYAIKHALRLSASCPTASSSFLLQDDEIREFLQDTSAFRRESKEKSNVGSRTTASFEKMLSSLGGSRFSRVFPASEAEAEKSSEIFEGHDADGFRPPICGETTFSTGEGESLAQFATVHKEKNNVHLMRFFADKVWALPRPDVIISVAGGAGNFNLSAGHKDRIMKGMMEGTRNLKPWFITGGTNAGVMKYVGEARAKYNPHAPLIGIAPLRALKGFSRLKSICQKESKKESKKDDSSGRVDTWWEWSPQEVSSNESDVQSSRENSDCMHRNQMQSCFAGQVAEASHSGKPSQKSGDAEVWKWDPKSGKWYGASNKKLVLSHDKLVEMDLEMDPLKSITVEPNHSHFIFVDDNGEGGPQTAFGNELEFRAAFESCESLSRISLPSPAFFSTD